MHENLYMFTSHVYFSHVQQQNNINMHFMLNSPLNSEVYVTKKHDYDF